MEAWPLTGRDGELARLRTWLGDPSCGGAVLSGPAGRGKTRLVTECLELAENQGAMTLRATATHSSSQFPFGALAALIADEDLPAEALSPARGDVFPQLVSTLARRAAGRRLILAVDDAHLLDPASATLVHRVAETRTAFVIAVVRSGEPAPDAVVALWKDGLTERLEVGALAVVAVRELLERALGGPVDGGAVAYLAARSEGNPLYLRELVISAVAGGSLRNDHGVWQLTEDPSPSDRLVELIEDRIRTLTQDEHCLLEYLAFAEPLGPLEVESLAGLETAEELERKSLVSSSLDDRRLQVRLAHPIYGDVLRSRIPALRQTTMARHLVKLVQGAGARRREDTLRIANWRLVGGGGGSADLMLTAAKLARHGNDYALADRLARFAMRTGGGFEAELFVAHLAHLRGRSAEAEERLAGLARTAESDDDRGRVALLRMNAAATRSQLDFARQIADEAAASISDPDVRDRVAARRSWLANVTEGPRAARAIALPVVERATGSALVDAAISLTLSLTKTGAFDEAVKVALRAEAADQALAGPLSVERGMLVYARCEALTMAGRLDDASLAATAEYEAAAASHSMTAQGLMAWTRSRICIERGTLHSATRFAQEAGAVFQRIEQPMYEIGALACQIQSLAMLGAADEATVAADRLREVFSPNLNLRAEVDLAWAWYWVSQGALPRARSHLIDSASAATENGDYAGAVLLWHTLARIGHPKDACEPLTALVEGVEGALAAARAQHVRGVAGSDASALNEAAAKFEAIGALLLAGEAMAAAAVAWTRAGDPRRATAAQRRSTALRELCEGPRTPAFEASETAAHLTQAERQTAVLAARGLSNRDIAAALTVSVRTVESHLQHVYQKLGISSRDQLADAL